MSKPTHSRPAVPNSERELLRHTIASLAYRGGKAIRNAPAGFADFNAGHGLRTPVQLLAHLGDLFDWALSIVRGQQKWADSKPLPWEQESQRFFAALKKFDDFLAASESLAAPPERLLQGPVADAFTHIGQIAMLRRMAGSHMKSENYYAAEIAIGRVGADQAKPEHEF